MDLSRKSNIELFRIILMFCIVAHHYVLQTGVLNYNILGRVETIYLYLFGMWGKTGINCFVIITGYFMCKSHVTFRKFLKLFLWILFYDSVITLIFQFTGYTHYPFKSIILLMLPIKNLTMGSGFESSYLVFFLFIPFLNILVQNMSRKQHLSLIGLCLCFFSVWAKLKLFPVDFNYVIWFCVVYLIGSYIRLNNIKNKLSYKNWGLITVLLLVAAMLSVVSFYIIFHDHMYMLMMDTNALFPILICVTAFLFFTTVPFPHSRIVNIVSSSTFGVYLISDNCKGMEVFLWKHLFNPTPYLDSMDIYVQSLLSVFIVFFVCIIIDQIRLRFFEKPLFVILDEYALYHNNKLFKLRWQ